MCSGYDSFEYIGTGFNGKRVQWQWVYCQVNENIIPVWLIHILYGNKDVTNFV